MSTVSRSRTPSPAACGPAPTCNCFLPSEVGWLESGQVCCVAGWVAERLVDATARRALTARRRVRPARAWVASSCTVPLRGLDPTLMLAAGRSGYAYRLGSARWLTLGWVGPGLPPPTQSELRRRIENDGGFWLCAGVELAAGRVSRRVASVALSERAPGIVVLGDAALARDALASQ